MPHPPTHDDITACRRCPLWAHATQGVAGDGARHARLMLVGEQPGDEEDRQGLPFVGPAGLLLRRALAEAGIDVREVYVTNAVKHFKWEPRGKRRIHKTPAQKEIAACHAWLDQELAAVQPAVIVSLGATALAALAGRKMTITDARAATLSHESGVRLVATYHPSAALRAPDEARRHELFDIIVADLRKAKRAAG